MAGFQSIDTALSGLLSNRRALDVISQNIANASNEDFSRRRALLKSNRPLQIGRLNVGTGVHVPDIVRSRDRLIDFRFRQENSNLGEFDKLSTVFEQLEGIVNEPSDRGVREALSQFHASLESLANTPENRGNRSDVIGKAQTFVNVMKRMNRQFQQIAGEGGGTGENSANAEIQSIVDEINEIGRTIANLNKEIKARRAAGGEPNDLLDQRDALIDDLSEFSDITVKRTQNSFRVNIAGFTLAQDGLNHEITFARKNGPKKQLLYDDPNQSILQPRGGELRALFDLRDEVIPGLVNQLNDLAVQYTDRFNDLHKAGFGLQGQTRNDFFAPLPTRESGVFRLEGMGDPNGTINEQRGGFIDSPDTVLTGDSSTARPENFENDTAVTTRPTGKLEINNRLIDYDMSEDTIRDIIDRINAGDNGAEAYLSAENRLVIKGTQENNYELDELRDSGLLLEKTHLLTVGGTSRTSKNDVSSTTANLDTELSLGGLNTGTLHFRRDALGPGSNDTFSVDYDATGDSLEDLVTQINTNANAQDVAVAAEVTSDNRLRVFASDSVPAGALNPGVSVDSEASMQIRDVEQGAGSDSNQPRILLSELGMDRLITSENANKTQFAVKGELGRPPQKEQVAGLKVSENIQNDPNLVAAARGTDTDLDGIGEASIGPGNGDNALTMSDLKSRGILDGATTSPDDHLREFVSGLGNEASLAFRERDAAENLVEDIKQQRKSVSGVSLDEEITKLIRHQQAFQAAARVISTTQEMTSALFQLV